VAREELVKVPAVLLGSRMRAKRKGLKLSQHQLGGEQFSPSYVSAVERGKIRPSLKALYILADRLGEPVAYFLQDEGAARSGDLLDETTIAAAIDILEGRPSEAINKLQGLALDGHTAAMQARVHLCLGQAYVADRQPAQAASSLLEALRLAERAGDTLAAAYARLFQGTAYYQQHKPGLALDLHRRCLQAINDGAILDLDYALQVYHWLGQDLIALGQEKDALPYFESAMKIARSSSDLRSLASALWAISARHKQANDAFYAHMYAQRSLNALEALHMLSTAASIHNTYGVVLGSAGQKETAEGLFREALAVGEHISDSGVSATATINLGELASEKQDYTQAEALISRGVEQATALGDNLVAGQGLLSLAQTYAAQARRADAEAQFMAAIARLERTGASNALSKAFFRYGQALVAWGESDKGSQYLERAYLQSHKA
jgi:transcriptional regulator with XRE-family HTH domain/Tfp pilus assembly protein PilF